MDLQEIETENSMIHLSRLLDDRLYKNSLDTKRIASETNYILSLMLRWINTNQFRCTIKIENVSSYSIQQLKDSIIENYRKMDQELQKKYDILQIEENDLSLHQNGIYSYVKFRFPYIYDYANFVCHLGDSFSKSEMIQTTIYYFVHYSFYELDCTQKELIIQYCMDLSFHDKNDVKKRKIEENLRDFVSEEGILKIFQFIEEEIKNILSEMERD